MTKLVSSKDFDEIVETLLSGGIVAFPTDTVYGIGVLYSDVEAVKRMKNAKIRPETKPFPLMVANNKQLNSVAYIGEREKKIVKELTPGALTLILNKKKKISDELTNGLNTIAIRIPDDKFVLKLLRKVGPMFVTSANLSGEPACNTNEEVMQQLNNRIEMVVKGEAYSHVASTIIDCTKSELVVLRQGDVTLEEINAALS